MKIAIRPSSRSTGPLSSKKVRSTSALIAKASHLHNHPARLFNYSPISPRKCRILLTKIALLLFTGETFPSNEATDLFFGISKLFQNKDPSLRQMMYLIFKELASSASDVIMVTQSIMKDTAEKSDVLYKANAIRALCRVIDVRKAHVVCLDLLKLCRQPLYKQSNVRSRMLLSTRILLYPPRPSCPHTIYFQLLVIW